MMCWANRWSASTVEMWGSARRRERLRRFAAALVPYAAGSALRSLLVPCRRPPALKLAAGIASGFHWICQFVASWVRTAFTTRLQ